MAVRIFLMVSSVSIMAMRRRGVLQRGQPNYRWCYTKSMQALRTGLGIESGRTTVANILAEAGIGLIRVAIMGDSHVGC